MSTFYVYMWLNDDFGGVPIYVGKGSGTRFKQLTGRSKSFLNHVKRWNCRPVIIADHLTEEDAYALEDLFKQWFVYAGYPILDAESKYRNKVSQRSGYNKMNLVDGKRVSAKTGRPAGRPEKRPADFQKFLEKQKGGFISVDAACTKMGISRSQWYSLKREMEAAV